MVAVTVSIASLSQFICIKLLFNPVNVIIVGGMSSCAILRILGGILHLSPKFDKIFCKQTVKVLLGRRIMRCLIWVCTVCLCPQKGLYAKTG